jgi:uncharacterized coiled-coil protein SlyX
MTAGCWRSATTVGIRFKIFLRPAGSSSWVGITAQSVPIAIVRLQVVRLGVAIQRASLRPKATAHYKALQAASTITAIGFDALFSNTTGVHNTALGFVSLGANTTGSFNIALGINAGENLTVGSNDIDIGNSGVAADSHTMRIGTQGTQIRTFIAGISGTAVTGAPVVVNASGQLGVAPSSQRFKDEIKPMDRASEAILALKPVTFHYKKEIDFEATPQFGLIAEDVAKVNPNLVVRDSDGKVYSVRYDAVNVMLLNEFLKEHRKVEEQQATITELKSTVARQQKDFQATAAHQQKQIEALTAGLQKVSAQFEANKPTPRVVANNH